MEDEWFDIDDEEREGSDSDADPCPDVDDEERDGSDADSDLSVTDSDKDLLRAIQAGDESAGARVNATDGLGRTPLHRAACGKNPEIVQKLLDGRANVNARAEDGSTPLYAASVEVFHNNLIGNDLIGNFSLTVETLLRARATVNARTDRGETALHRACSFNRQPELVMRLLHAGACVATTDDTGRTPLHCAASSSTSPEIIKMLLYRGARVNATDDSGCIPLHLSLDSRGSCFGEIDEDLLEVVKMLLNARSRVNAASDSGTTAINLAGGRDILDSQFPALLQMLLDARADANTRSYYHRHWGGDRPILVVAQLLPAETMKMLLDARANTDVTDEAGKTPLHHASVSTVEGEEVVKTLLDARADTNAKDGKGYTPLHDATMEQKPEVVKTLLDARASPDTTNEEGYTPLHHAVVKDDAEIVTMLLDASASLNAIDGEGYTPLHWAVHMEHSEIVELLKAAGADTAASDDEDEGNSPSQAFAEDFVKMLLDAGSASDDGVQVQEAADLLRGWISKEVQTAVAAARAKPVDDDAPAGSQYAAGDFVRYWSSTKNRWMDAIVEGVREKGGVLVYDLNCKRGAPSHSLQKLQLDR